jgi:hypothetical protein
MMRTISERSAEEQQARFQLELEVETLDADMAATEDELASVRSERDRLGASYSLFLSIRRLNRVCV